MKKSKDHSLELLEFEKRLWAQGFQRIMGLDEVGRGCLAGPVVAAGVILDEANRIEGLNDSKQLTAAARERLEPIIKERAVAWAICEASVAEIDRLNILKASMLAMNRCVDSISPGPDYLLIDGNYYPPTLTPHETIIKGDARSASIAAASILAKVYRDRLMRALALEFPAYGWDSNAGYPTAFHIRAVKSTGTCIWHRTTFKIS